MNILNTKECFRLIRKMEMMDHIIDHSIMVSNVALCLCRLLEEKCPDINMESVRCAALLHDITKTRSFTTGEIHSETGGILLNELGSPEIGNIIRQHVTLDACLDDTPITESEIVNYADKRVLHDQVVSLKERLEYIKIRYGSKPEFKGRVKPMWRNALALEEKLFKQLPFLPSQLPGRVLPIIKKTEINKKGQSTT